MKVRRLNGVLIALAVLAVLVIGRLIPQQGETILLWLLSAGVGIAVLLRPVLGLYMMVGLIPLTNEIVLVEGVSTSRIVGMVTIGAWLVGKLARREPLSALTSGSMTWPIISYTSLVVLSGLWAESSSLWTAAMPTVVRLVLMFFMVSDIVTSWSRLRNLILILLCSGLLAMTIGAYVFFFQGTLRASWGYGTANGFSSLVLVLLPFAFYFFVHGRKLERSIGLLSVAVGVVALGASVTRTSLVIGLFLLLYQFWEWRQVGQRRLIVVVAIVLVVASLFVPWDAIADRMAGLVAGDEITTIEGRGFRWRVAVLQILDHPVLGVGYANYGAAYYTYAGKLDPRVLFLGGSARKVVHSLYFGILAELGVAGLVLFAWLIGTSLKVLRSAISRERELDRQDTRWLLVALRISFLCYLLYSVALSTEDSKLLWLLFALVEVAGRLAPAPLADVALTPEHSSESPYLAGSAT